MRAEAATILYKMNDKKIERSWAMFDWANSAYALVITTAIFPAYFMKSTKPIIDIGSISISNSSLYAFSISFAYIIIAFLSPILSGISDFEGIKKPFLKFFTVMGSLACMSLFLFKGNDTWYIGTVGFIVATIGYVGGLVFYNSYLPEIVTEDRYDIVSAKGFAYGYIGSVLLLLFNLWVIQEPGTFGLEEGTLPIRMAFITVGLWWILFAQIPFKYLPGKNQKLIYNKNILSKGYDEIKLVWEEVKNTKNIKWFLASFFFYNAGVQTAIYMASTFAEKELHFETAELIILILLLQFVGLVGAYLFAKLSEKKGNAFTLILLLVIWTSVCFSAYLIKEKIHFYYVASAVGLVMGGIQAISRSTFSKLLPKDLHNTTSYFSFYDVVDKAGVVFGTFSFGMIELMTGNMRQSILSIATFFLIGLIIFSKVRVKHSTYQRVVN